LSGKVNFRGEEKKGKKGEEKKRGSTLQKKVTQCAKTKISPLPTFGGKGDKKRVPTGHQLGGEREPAAFFWEGFPSARRVEKKKRGWGEEKKETRQGQCGSPSLFCGCKRGGKGRK